MGSHRLLLAAPLLVLAAAACGGDDEAAPATSVAVTTTSTSATTAPVTPPTTAAATTVAPTTAATTAPPTTTPPTTAPATTAPETSDADAGPTVTLLDPGAEPRSPLRFDLAAGTSVMTTSQSQEITQTFGGRTQPTAAFGLVFVMQIDTVPVADGYEVTSTLTSVASGPDIAADVAAALDEQLGLLVGFRSVSVVDDRGRILRAEVDETTLAAAPAEIADLMRQLGESNQVAAPLPDEAVGVGARWQVEQRLELNGISLVQTTEYTLTAVDGSVLTIEVVGGQTPTETTVELPGLEGIDVEILEWTTSTTGSLIIDLASVVPTSSAVTDAQQVLDIVGEGELSQTILSTIEVAPTTAG